MPYCLCRRAVRKRPFSWYRERVDVGEGAPRGRGPRRQERGRRLGGWEPGFSCTEGVIRHEAPKDDVIALLSPTVRPLSCALSYNLVLAQSS